MLNSYFAFQEGGGEQLESNCNYILECNERSRKGKRIELDFGG